MRWHEFQSHHNESLESQPRQKETKRQLAIIAALPHWIDYRYRSFRCRARRLDAAPCGGVRKITQCCYFTAFFMAIVFDLSQVCAEFTTIVIPILKINDTKLRYVCRFIMISCTLVSITMNVRAFLAHTQTHFEVALAVTWGVLLPLLVLLLCYVTAVFITTGQRKKK